MDLTLLKKFYKGECTAEEAVIVQSWFDSDNEKDKVLEFLETYWQDFEDAEHVSKDYSSASLLHQINTRIAKETPPARRTDTPFALPAKNAYFLRIAAIVLVAFGLAFLFQTINDHTLAREANLTVQQQVARGEKHTVLLDDGTKVTLNSGSKLIYPSHFTSNTRKVSLEGEAFFEVARNEKKPFIIITQDIHTTVLGTSFNVKAYYDDPDIRVSVGTGKVKVARLDNPATAYELLAGQEVVYQALPPSFAVGKYDQRATLAWKDNIIYFKDASFKEVISTLERWYGVDIQQEGQGDESWEYSGVFENQTLENVLLSISYVKHFSYEIQGKNIKIQFNNL